jgi:ABC-type transporter MlaC component
MKLLYAAILTFVFTSTSLTAAPRGSDALAEKFVGDFTSKMISLATNRDKSFSERSSAIRIILKENTATRKIVIFMLGRYARKIDRADFPKYMNLMEDYAMRVFVNRMLYARNAHTAKITVVSSKRKDSREAIVLTKLSVKNLKEPLHIRWHLVRGKDNKYKLFNLGVEGFWLAQEQRSQFVNFIQKNGGDPKVILPHIRKKIEQSKEDTRIRDVRPPPRR